ncbi:MAG TPA: hypothetical protein VJ625_12895 [Propionibacteriaceae bacterium]|nr:hypothetical protein [Propionibacteriaceae bacterium]
MTNPYEEQQPQAQPSPQTPYQPSGQYQPSGDPSQQTPYQAPGQYQPAGQPAPYGQPYGPPTQEHPQGTMILIFGILGIFITIFAPIAWYLGNKARADIQTSGIRYSNEQNISIGRMLGKIFTIIAIVWIVFVIIWIIIAAVAASSG